MKLKVSIIIPCYKASGKVGSLISRINQVIPIIKNDCQISIYLVNDCCPQDSWKEVKHYQNLTILHHSKNRGVGAATLTGFYRALKEENDFFIKMDADCQHPPEYLAELVPYLLSLPPFELFLVKGSRFCLPYNRDKVPFIRRFGSFFLEPLSRLAMSYRGLTDIANGFISLNRITLEYLISKRFKNNIKSRFLFESSVLKSCSNLGAEVHEFYMYPVYGDDWTSSMKTFYMILPILFFWFKSIFERIMNKYLISFNFGSSLFISSLLNGFISINLFFSKVLPMINNDVFVTAGNATGFTTSLLLSVILFCLFILYDFSNRINVKKIFFRYAALK
tara:strand:- start:107 stop:1111 length:1005 start_codon:yes stop_codon:yes gene_type:complete